MYRGDELAAAEETEEGKGAELLEGNSAGGKGALPWQEAPEAEGTDRREERREGLSLHRSNRWYEKGQEEEAAIRGGSLICNIYI